MKTTELRIGNYILDEENEVRQVMELSRTLISTSCDFTLLTSEVKPIPLTEDILIKCGFTKVLLDSNNPEEGYYYSLRLSDDKYCDLSLLSGDKNGIFEVYLFPYDNIRFQYLHQMQNIYHSLTGKELKI